MVMTDVRVLEKAWRQERRLERGGIGRWIEHGPRHRRANFRIPLKNQAAWDVNSV
jgi:hypothetical protein